MTFNKNILLFAAFFGFMACSDDDPTPEPEEDPKNIVELASDTPNLSILVQAVTAAGLVNDLSAPGPFTVLAPTNQAFQALLDSNPAWNELSDIDTDVLRQVLLYHVVSGSVPSSSLSANQEVTMQNGELLTVTQVGSTVTFNDTADVITADVEASNGIVHIIDAVLLPPSLTAVNENTLMMIEDETFGNVFTDGRGHVLYYFARDVKGANNCTGGCANNWPIFYAEEIMVDDPDFDEDLVGQIDVDGEMQSTYNGWPLYTFVNDEEPGDTNGEGGGGGNWYVAKPDYSLMLANDQLVGNDGNNYILSEEGVLEMGDGNTPYFTDFDGRTLYRFRNDVANQSNYGGNVANWPDFTTPVTIVPSVLSLEDFGVIAENQVTFRSNPIYYYGQDAERGETKGVSAGGGNWPIINRSTAALTAE
ncbi:fasciclin domain-containing protein [Lunatibacter salilacus]|uniref:fasciclin domain-containing protein n=1 Tax=Lunatibacter salilacus TaxID=2483804 RepID=UPI00131DDADD|nr:fasciclin domain-containing protein [Lunatibacter salilacus]